MPPAPPETQSPTEEPTFGPTDPNVHYTPENLFCISVTISSERLLSDYHTPIFDFSYQTIYLTVPDAEVADKVIIDFLRRMDDARQDAAIVQAQAQADYFPSEQWIPYAYQVRYNPTRVDQGVLSLFGEMIRFSGGSHSDKTYASANYDMLTGDVLTLGSILYHLDAKESLVALINRKLDEMSATTYLYSYYQEAVSDFFDQDESYLECFYFTGDGLTFYFAPYVIAPYASGVIEVNIPYAELTGIIGDQFFPAAQQKTVGEVQAHLFSDADVNRYDHFAELIADEGGEKIILETTGVIHNVRIYSGHWNIEATQYYKDGIIFAANVLDSMDAIMVQTNIPDVLPTLLLTYESNDQTYGYYIFQSGQDGSIILEQAALS